MLLAPCMRLILALLDSVASTTQRNKKDGSNKLPIWGFKLSSDIVLTFCPVCNHNVASHLICCQRCMNNDCILGRFRENVATLLVNTLYLQMNSIPAVYQVIHYTNAEKLIIMRECFKPKLGMNKIDW